MAKSVAGKKRCPVDTCKALVGVRTRECPKCTHIFMGKQTVKKDKRTVFKDIDTVKNIFTYALNYTGKIKKGKRFKKPEHPYPTGDDFAAARKDKAETQALYDLVDEYKVWECVNQLSAEVRQEIDNQVKTYLAKQKR